MTKLWSALRQREKKTARALRTILHLECLEERNLLSGLVVAPSPQIAGRLNATAAISANDIWAVGSDQQLGNPTLAEHFNGKTWSVVPTPSGIEGRFNGVSGVASNDVWAVGTMTGPDNPDFGEQFIEHWNGKSWSVVASPTVEGDALNSVVAVSANNVWAVGAIAPEGANALIEHWDGTSWSIVSNSVIAGAGRLSSVSADAANDVWAVGEAGNGGAPLLHFNGTTWSQTPNPAVPMQANAVLALSPTDVWAVGKKQYEANHRVQFRASIEQWNGTSWSIVASPTTSDTSLNGIAAISANNILAVGGGGAGASTTLVEQWNGTSWSILSSPNPGDFANGLSGVTALSDGTVAAVGFQESETNGFSPLILQNAASAPQTAAATAPLAASAATVGGTSGASLPPGSSIDDQTRTLPAPSDSAAVDQFFAAVGEVDQQLWLLSYNLGTRHTTANGDLNGLPGGM